MSRRTGNKVLGIFLILFGLSIHVGLASAYAETMDISGYLSMFFSILPLFIIIYYIGLWVLIISIRGTELSIYKRSFLTSFVSVVLYLVYSGLSMRGLISLF